LGPIVSGQIIDAIGRLIDLAGVLVIAGAIAGASVAGARRLLRRELSVYHRLRQDIGRGILLGLELLVAADIIRTVAISPSLESVAVLAGIVLVRTLLSFILEVEVTGRWPWQRPRDSTVDEYGR
jgi:uncharacterized membrane protein